MVNGRLGLPFLSCASCKSCHKIIRYVLENICVIGVIGGKSPSVLPLIFRVFRVFRGLKPGSRCVGASVRSAGHSIFFPSDLLVKMPQDFSLSAAAGTDAPCPVRKVGVLA